MQTGRVWDLPGYQSKNISKQVKNEVDLDRFGAAVNAYLDVPAAVRVIESSGKATLRLKKSKQGVWSVHSYTGDRFARAILYEALSQSDPKRTAFPYLAQTEFSTLRIDFSYHIASDLKAPPVEISSAGNRIVISRTYWNDNHEWTMLVVQNGRNSPEFGVNLIGVADNVIHMLDKRSPFDDPAVRRLQLSPAYAAAHRE